MILVDTSAWVEFLRATGSETALRLRDLLADNEPLASCDPVRMELLAGARPSEVGDLRRLLARTSVVTIRPDHWDDAALLYRQCRARGETVRKLIDCLIGVAAISAGAAVLHADADFDVLARHTSLQTVR